MRSDREVAVQFPERAYALVGQLLAQAVEDVEVDGGSPRAALGKRAREFGHQLGVDSGPAEQSIIDSLELCGYEPRVEGNSELIVLVNCPFHALAQQHTAMVCGMNLELIGGVLEGAGCTDRTAQLAPAEGYCCVRIAPRSGTDR